jgi:hypothetical protein
MSYSAPKYINKEEEETIKKTAEVVGSIFNFTVSGSFLSLVFGFSLMQLFGLIRGIQFLAYLALIHLHYPANIFIFMLSTMEIAQIDVLQGNEITDYLFTFSNENPLSSYFE